MPIPLGQVLLYTKITTAPDCVIGSGRPQLRLSFVIYEPYLHDDITFVFSGILPTRFELVSIGILTNPTYFVEFISRPMMIVLYTMGVLVKRMYDLYYKYLRSILLTYTYRTQKYLYLCIWQRTFFWEFSFSVITKNIIGFSTIKYFPTQCRAPTILVVVVVMIELTARRITKFYFIHYGFCFQI